MPLHMQFASLVIVICSIQKVLRLVLGKLLVQTLHKQVEEHVLEVVVGVVLVQPVVADEDTGALEVLGQVGGAVSVLARDGLEGVGVVVADVGSKGGLLVGPVVGPVLAPLPLLAAGAVVPGVEDLVGAGAVLGDDEARVPVDAALVVLVGLGVGVLGHGERRLGRDAPEAEQPLKGHLRLGKVGVAVEEDDKVVRLERLADHGHLDPGAVAVLVVGGTDETVVVAVDQSWRNVLVLAWVVLLCVHAEQGLVLPYSWWFSMPPVRASMVL